MKTINISTDGLFSNSNLLVHSYTFLHVFLIGIYIFVTGILIGQMTLVAIIMHTLIVETLIQCNVSSKLLYSCNSHLFLGLNRLVGTIMFHF